MMSNEILGCCLILFAILLMGIIGYLAEYARYILRYISKYGKKVFKRGLRYLKRL